MQIKTIKKVISSKMEEWLKTIEDESLRNDVKKELLVSGGSIASLFLGEQVNDFDVYIKTPETVKRLADYYLKAFPQFKAYMGKDKDKLLNEAEFDGNDETLNAANFGAGITRIFFENLHPEQVKIWLDKGAGFKTEFNDEGLGKYVPVYFSPNAISLSDKVQIVTRFTGDHTEIHKSFDFIHATNYFTFGDGLVTNIEALQSLLTKQLKYQGSLYPLTSILRAKKFIKRNWNINAGEYLKIMFQISQLDLTNFNVLEEALQGVDVVYFQVLIDILRDKKEKDDGFVLNYEYLLTLIDRVFSDSEEEQ